MTRLLLSLLVLRGRLTPLQRTLRRRCPYPVVVSVDEALALFGVTPR